MKTVVEVELTNAQEIALMDRYGRKCSRETLVKRAIAEVLKQQAEDVPVFEGKEAFKARTKAERELAEQEAAKAAELPPEVEALLKRFRYGEKFTDLEGREVSALEANRDPELKDAAAVVIQVDGDNSEWYPVALSELQPMPEPVKVLADPDKEGGGDA